jgi:hypothetical protein
MFRESDFSEQKLHSTYSTKPKSKFQELSQAAKFDESGLSSRAYKDHNGEAVPIIPTTWDTLYDPTNPEADWSGLVNKDFNHKRHIKSHISQQIGLTQTEHGIVSKIEKQEWAHKRQPTIQASSNQSTLVLGGIHEQNDQWKTTYKSFEAKENTNRDQLSLEKRTRPMMLIPDPAQARSAQRVQMNSTISTVNAPTSSVLCNRAPSYSNRSMLSMLGSDLADRVIEPTPIRSLTSQPRILDVLVSQNYNPNPGLLFMGLYGIFSKPKF